MKKIVLILFLNSFLYAQVGVGTISPNAALEINSSLPSPSTHKAGLLPPIVALTATNSIATTAAGVNVINPNGGGNPATGTIVYNTNTSLVGANQVTPGYYFFNGTIWEKISTGANKNWELLGNADTNPAINFLGTTDAQNLQFRTNGIERLAIGATNGNVVIGIPTIPTTTRLEVDGGATGDGIYGHTGNVGGILGREASISLGVPIQTLSGAGVYANNPSPGYTSIYAQSTGAASVAANIAYSDVWMASYNYVQNGSATYNPSASYSQLNVTNNGLGGNQIASRGLNSRGTIAGNPGYSIGAQGIADSQNQDSFGVQGISFSNGITAGGYFEGLTYAGISRAYAYVGANTTGTNRKIVGTGSVSEIIPTENYGRVTLTCPESPEYWYQDYGTIQMVNGKATIVLDEILADIIIVDEENPIRVICTPVGMPYFNGVTIMSQTKKSVEILELNGGEHSGKLQYQIVVKPKTNYGEGRFPQAPGPAYLKSDKEPIAAKAKNQPNDGRNIYQWPADHIVYKYNPEEHIKVGDVVPAGTNAGKIFLGQGKYSNGMPVENPEKKKK